MKLSILLALLALCAASGPHAAGAARGTSAGRPRPQCTAAFAVRRTKQGKSQRVKLPMCSAAPIGMPPPAPSTRLAAAAGAPPPAVASGAYPCTVGNAACYCQYRNAVGFFADNDPAVACG